MGGTGLEPTPLAPPKTPISEKRQESGTKSGTREPDSDPDLVEVIDRWAALPEHVKQAVLALVRSDGGKEQSS
jgi:hypothetical protein